MCKPFLIAIGATALLMLTPSAASATGAPNHHRVIIGVGDSFTSGEGNPPFIAGTDTATDQCHRSNAAYPIVAAHLIGATGLNVACSGAETKDLFTTFKSEPAQASRLNHATDIVTTIGGNDINALESIANPPSPAQLGAELQALAPVLAQTCQKLHDDDPSARIFAVGYPSIFSTAPSPGCPLSQQTRAAVVAGTHALDITIQQAAAQAHVSYVDTFNAFAGHELCTAPVNGQPSVPWVNGLDIANPSFSLHPNAVGQAKIAGRVAAVLESSACPTSARRAQST